MWKKWTGLHKVLILTRINPFGMNYSRECELGLLALEEWAKMPINTVLNFVESLSRKDEAY